MKKIKNWNQDEILSVLHELVKLKGNCIGVIYCNTCLLSDFRTERNESGSNCTSTKNVETAWKMVHEIQVSELINII